MSDLDAIEQRHQRSWMHSTNDVCSWCHDLWPCDTAVLAAELREARAEADAWVEQVKATHAARQKLKAELREARAAIANAERVTADVYAAREHYWSEQVASLSAIRERAEAERQRLALGEPDKNPRVHAVLSAVERILGDAAPSPEPLLIVDEVRDFTRQDYEHAKRVLGVPAPSPEPDAVLVQNHPPRWMDRSGEWHEGIQRAPSVEGSETP